MSYFSINRSNRLIDPSDFIEVVRREFVSIRELTPVIGGVLIFAHSSRSNSWNLARNRVRTERFFPLERFAEEASLPMRLESGRKVGPRLSGRYNRDI